MVTKMTSRSKVVMLYRRCVLGVLSTACLLSSACAGKESVSHVQYVDEMTGVTVRAMTHPVTFYIDNPSLAVNARDFASLAAIETNRGGQYSYYLWVGLWSTIDRRFGSQAEFRPTADWLLLDGDDHQLELPMFSDDSMLVGISDRLFAVGDPNTVEAYYKVTADDLRLIASADVLTLSVGAERDKTRRYSLWEQDKAGLQRFVTRVVNGDVWSDEFKAQSRR